MKFIKNQLHVFSAAAVAGMASSTMMKGINGSGPVHFPELALDGLLTGVNFTAYPIAVKVVTSVCPHLKKQSEDPRGSKIPLYLTAGTLSACITVSGRSLIEYNRSLLRNEKYKCNFLKDFILQTPASIGFAAGKDVYLSNIPKMDCSLAEWARESGATHAGSLSSKILQYPVANLLNGVTFQQQLDGFISTLLPFQITSDAFKRALPVLSCIGG